MATYNKLVISSGTSRKFGAGDVINSMTIQKNGAATFENSVVSDLNVSGGFAEARSGTGLTRVNVISGGRGTARETMKGLGVTVAGKTGTAQTGMLGSDHGAFICFAPAEDPEIAICVYGEKAAHGATLGLCAKAIIQYYFENNERAGSVAAYENTLG